MIFDIILRPCGPGDCSHTTSECSSRNHYQIVEDRMILSTGGHIGSRYNEPVTSWLQTIVNHRNIEKAEEELMSPVQREDLQHLTHVFFNSMGWGGCTTYTSKGLPLERSPDGFQIVELTSPVWPVEIWPGRMGIRVYIIIEDRMEGTGDQQQPYMEKRQFCVDIPSKKSFLVLDREEGVVGIASLEKNT